MAGGNPTVVFTQPREIAIEDREIPSPGEGELLIKTRMTMISTGTELTILNGQFPRDSAWANYGKFPFLPGYNNIGEVVGVSPSVDKEWIGKRVASYGSHAQYVIAGVESVRTIERDVPEDQVVFFTIAEIVMNGVRRGRVEWGDAVAVYGAGLLGQFTARFCRMCGARPVFVIDVANGRLQRLPEDPLIIKLNPNEVDIVSAVDRGSRGRKAGVVFEVTGNATLIPSEFRILRRQGRFVVLSSPGGETLFDFHDLCNSPSFTIIGAHNSSHPTQATPDNPWTMKRHFELFVDLLADGELDVRPLISHREPYRRAVELYQMLLRDRSQAMGVILEWEGFTAGRTVGA
jgi:2-desacetyl-2-hydroxyethyl bacteriochlorophyllide A dehydrogenase